MINKVLTTIFGSKHERDVKRMLPMVAQINSLEPDPTHRYAILLTRSGTKMRDRVDVGPATLQQYDLKEHKLMRTIGWPDGEERDNANLMFSPDGKLVEIVELPKHPFFIACQFHPEFQSKPHQPHPLFKGFIAAAHQRIHQRSL